MTETAIFTSSTQTEQSRQRWKLWLAIAVVSLLLHLLFLSSPAKWLGPGSIALPPRVDVQQIDQRKLDEIRKQWKRQSLLVDRDKNAPSEKEAPKDARYFSDRNIRVEKEQKARRTDVLPKPKTDAQPERPQTQKRQLPSLGNLGVPMDLSAPPKPRAKTPDPGAAQALPDENLPEGNMNLLNAQESVYYSFYARIYETIGPIWQSKARAQAMQRSIAPGEYLTVVEIVLDRQGHLQAINFQQRSGVTGLDYAVEESWRQVKQFQNPPSGLLSSDGLVRMNWSFSFQVQSP